jgi:hypothetical protein
VAVICVVARMRVKLFVSHFFNLIKFACGNKVLSGSYLIIMIFLMFQALKQQVLQRQATKSVFNVFSYFRQEGENNGPAHGTAKL